MLDLLVVCKLDLQLKSYDYMEWDIMFSVCVCLCVVCSLPTVSFRTMELLSCLCWLLWASTKPFGPTGYYKVFCPMRTCRRNKVSPGTGALLGAFFIYLFFWLKRIFEGLNIQTGNMPLQKPRGQLKIWSPSLQIDVGKQNSVWTYIM